MAESAFDCDACVCLCVRVRTCVRLCDSVTADRLITYERNWVVLCPIRKSCLVIHCVILPEKYVEGIRVCGILNHSHPNLMNVIIC